MEPYEEDGGVGITELRLASDVVDWSRPSTGLDSSLIFAELAEACEDMFSGVMLSCGVGRMSSSSSDE